MATLTPLDERLPARFWNKMAVAPGGCWIWLGSLRCNGYGEFRWESRNQAAHRVSYSQLVAPIPDGLVIDHLCRNRRCVNPLHLEAVTQRINLLRGMGVTARNASRTHCPQGHPYDEANTVYDQGKRKCRECLRVRSSERYYRRMEARRGNSSAA